MSRWRWTLSPGIPDKEASPIVFPGKDLGVSLPPVFLEHHSTEVAAMASELLAIDAMSPRTLSQKLSDIANSCSLL